MSHASLSTPSHSLRTRAPDAFRGGTRQKVIWAVAFVSAHVVLAPVMRAYPAIATVHAVICLLGGLGFAATTRRPHQVALFVAYVVGCEVLWRMCKAAVFWEYGKYVIVAVMLTAIARMRTRRNLTLAIAYFGLLVPSAALTLISQGLVTGRDMLSFSLSGALALACAVVYFSSIRLTSNQLRATFIAAIGPILGVSTLVFLKASEVGTLEFFNGSNQMASGGFGPNQVSAMLGLAMMFLVLLSFDRRLVWWLRLTLLAVAAVLAFQTILTFARGGIMLALAGIFVAMFFLASSNRRARVAVASIGLLSFLIGTYVVEPRLEQATSGEVSKRYLNTQSSGRDQIIDSELQLFLDHPALGVGPGVGTTLRLQNGGIGPSHTEYTRMLGEHGALGALAMLCMVLIGARAIRGARDSNSRAAASAMLTWAALFLAIYSTRLAAPSFMIGLAFAVPRPPNAVRKLPIARGPAGA